MRKIELFLATSLVCWMTISPAPAQVLNPTAKPAEATDPAKTQMVRGWIRELSLPGIAEPIARGGWTKPDLEQGGQDGEIAVLGSVGTPLTVTYRTNIVVKKAGSIAFALDLKTASEFCNFTATWDGATLFKMRTPYRLGDALNKDTKTVALGSAPAAEPGLYELAISMRCFDWLRDNQVRLLVREAGQPLRELAADEAVVPATGEAGVIRKIGARKPAELVTTLVDPAKHVAGWKMAPVPYQSVAGGGTAAFVNFEKLREMPSMRNPQIVPTADLKEQRVTARDLAGVNEWAMVRVAGLVVASQPGKYVLAVALDNQNGGAGAIRAQIDGKSVPFSATRTRDWDNYRGSDTDIVSAISGRTVAGHMLGWIEIDVKEPRLVRFEFDVVPAAYHGVGAVASRIIPFIRRPGENFRPMEDKDVVVER